MSSEKDNKKKDDKGDTYPCPIGLQQIERLTSTIILPNEKKVTLILNSYLEETVKVFLTSKRKKGGFSIPYLLKKVLSVYSEHDGYDELAVSSFEVKKGNEIHVHIDH
jgi:hypothetical protein